MKVFAGIVVYYPDFARLSENLNAIRQQVDAIGIWDNGGLSGFTVEEGIIVLSQNGENVGIATALNGLCSYAEQNGYAWILTLDQDSIAPSGLISAYSGYCQDKTIGLLCPCIHDRNYGSMEYDRGSSQETDTVDACITSASMLRISAWKKIGGFWNELFIDMVDFDLCWSLQAYGYRVVRVNNQTLYHEIGHSRKIKFLGKDNVVYNHSPFRCYYIARNTIAVGRRHNRVNQCRRWILKRALLITLFESEKLIKIRMIIKGIHDGIRLGRRQR